MKVDSFYHHNGDPLISVIMPAYNAEAFVGEAIESIQAQTLQDIELLIIDDGSRDETMDIANRYAASDRRIRLLAAEHGGSYKARNLGLQAARGGWIAHMDADDISLPERFASQMEWIERHKLDICGTWAEIFGIRPRINWFPETQAGIHAELIFRNALLHGTVMFRAEIGRQHLYDENLETMGDYEFWTRLAGHYMMGNLPKVLYRWRSHAQQIHIVRRVEASRIMSGIRRRYIAETFPADNLESRNRLARLAEGFQATSLTELESAGTWLVRLAEGNEPLVRRRMAERWRDACYKAAPLGPDCFKLYSAFKGRFGLEQALPAPWLGPAALLRIKRGSRLHRVYRWLKAVKP